jgi:hypothetical protein
MYSKIIKKSKEQEPATKMLQIGKKASEHALKSMAPEMEDEDGDEEEMPMKKGMMPEAKIEIELMIESAKKKKKA